MSASVLKNLGSRLALAAALASMGGVAAHAQAPQAEPDGASPETRLGEIVVTAQKRSERERDVPMSISAVTGEELRSRGITSTDDLTKIAPGFSAQKTQYGLPIYFIRGVGFYDTTLGVSPAVTVYVDQVPLPYSPMARGAILDLERVEILKGPQGTLFGQNSTGGAVNYIAAKPTRDFTAGVSLDYGRFDSINLEGFVSGPLSDTVALRFAARGERSGDWQNDYANGNSVGSKEYFNGRAILDWTPADSMRFSLQLTGWQDTSEIQQPQLAKYVQQTPVSAGGRPPAYPIETFPQAPKDAREASWDPGVDFHRDDELYQASLRADFDLSDSVSLSSITAYSDYSSSLPQDFDGTLYPFARADTNGEIDTFSQELRLAGSAGSFRWMVGGNYQDDTVNEVLKYNPVQSTNEHIGPFEWSSFTNYNDQKVETGSVFASVDFDLSNALTAQLSARYTDQRRSFRGCSADSGNGEIATAFNFLSSVFTGVPGTIAPGECITLGSDGFPLPIVTGDLNEDNLAWRAGLSWKPSEDVMLYGNITQGYKSGSFPTLASAAADQLSGIKQESLLAYELGSKLSVLDRKLDIELAAFYYDYSDKQLSGYRSIVPFGPLAALVSIPESRVVGAEFNFTARPTAGLTVQIGGTYVDSEVRANPDIPIGPFGSPADFVGQPFPYTPRWQGMLDGEYRFDVGPGHHAYLGLTVIDRSETRSSLLSNAPADIENEQELLIDAYTTLDLRAGILMSDDRLGIELWGRNITDEFYSLNNMKAGDWLLRFPGAPATYGVTVRYHFQ